MAPVTEPHWTYATLGEPESNSLFQGDILEPTDELKAILEHVHPHFCSEKYLAFIVTSQSCDLVRRRTDPPKAAYISIATVRQLYEVLPKLLANSARRVGGQYFLKSSKERAQQLLDRLLDQNEQATGLFYLHPDSMVKLGDPAVAFLRVSVSLRSDHYDALLRARTGTLTPEFRAKLGWLVGNLYARAATRDWDDDADGKEEKRRILKSILDHGDMEWVDDKEVAAAKKAGVKFDELPLQELPAMLERHRPPPPIDVVVGEVLTAIDDVLPDEEAVAKAIEYRRRKLLEEIEKSGLLRGPELGQMAKLLDEHLTPDLQGTPLTAKQREQLNARVNQNGSIKALLRRLW